MGESSHEEPLTTEQSELVERFLVAFNEIESKLRLELRGSPMTSFTRLVDLYGNKQPVWLASSGYQLRNYAGLRNALIHLRQE